MSKFWRYIFVFLLLSVVLVVMAAFSIPDDRLHLVVCDVGQGDGILIYKKSVQVVMDGGPDDKILSCLSRHVPFWDRKIEMVVLTNPDADHYTGLIDLLKDYEVSTYVAPDLAKDDVTFRELEKVVEEQEKKGMRRIKGVQGQEERLGGIDLKNLWPTREFLAESKNNELGIMNNGENDKVLGTWAIVGKGKIVNELSLVFELQYGAFRALLTGDVQPPSTDLASQYIQGPVDVLKVPHHGSKNGLTQMMLDLARPKLAIISDGKNNKFGHPNKETLDLLDQSGVKVLRTDQSGDVEVITDGKSWSYKTN